MVKQVIGLEDWGFAFSASNGSAHGILCCWEKSTFEVAECTCEQRFVLVKER